MTKVDLNNNELGPEVGTLIAGSLKANSTLETLDLRWNRLCNQGAKAILKGLSFNKNLTLLELAGNRVSDDVLKQVSDCLTRNLNGEPIINHVSLKQSLSRAGRSSLESKI